MVPEVVEESSRRTGAPADPRPRPGARARRATAATILVAALVGAGCGGGAQDQISATVKDFYSGLLSNDGKKSCDQLDAKTQQAVQRSIRASSCGAAIGRLSKVLPSSLKDRIKKATVTNIKVNGDHATATVKGGGQSGSVALTKQGGDWKISNFPG